MKGDDVTWTQGEEGLLGVKKNEKIFSEEKGQ